MAFEKQLRQSDGVIEAQFLGSSSIRTADEEVLTQATFIVKRAVGFSQGEVANKQRLVVVYPGGQWQGINYSIAGSPKFQAGEEVFLLLNKGRHGYSLSNFALGKYKVEWVNGQKQLISEVFPNHPDLGRIAFSKVEKNIMNVFGRNLDEANNDQHIAMGDRKIEEGRYPASVGPSEMARTLEMRTGFWLAVLLGVLGAVSIWFVRQRR